MVTITFSANGKKIDKTIEFTSNDTEKNAPVLTPDELKPSISSNRKFVGIHPFYAISNICIR
jgi:hypothetical protein